MENKQNYIVRLSGRIFKLAGFLTSRIGLAQSVMTTPEVELNLVIQHRFAEIETGAYNFFRINSKAVKLNCQEFKYYLILIKDHCDPKSILNCLCIK